MINLLFEIAGLTCLITAADYLWRKYMVRDQERRKNDKNYNF